MSEKDQSFEVVLYEGLEIIFDAQYEPWMTQAQIADMLGITSNGVTKALSRAYHDNDLNEDQTSDNLSLVAQDGKTRKVRVFNLDAIMLVGFRAHSSHQAVAFRRWATSIVRRHLQTEARHFEQRAMEAELRAHHATKDLESRWEQELMVRYPEEF